jgi:hypothetical protein
MALVPIAGAGSALFGCGGQTIVAASSAQEVAQKGAGALVFDPTQIGFGINHYLVTGQSLATGEQGFFGISNIQPFNNMMLGPDSNFTYATLGASVVELIPLVSGTGVRETMGNGFADSLTAQANAVLPETQGGPTTYNSLVTCSGVPGYYYQQLCGPTDWNPSNPYWVAAGGGTAGFPPFQEMMSQVSFGQTLAKSLGLSYRVAGMIFIHGEFDNANPSYPMDLVHWQSDMQNGVQAITGQTGTIPMIAAQTQAILNTDEFAIGGGAGLYNAAVANPSTIFIGSPEYACMHHLVGELVDGMQPFQSISQLMGTGIWV